MTILSSLLFSLGLLLVGCEHKTSKAELNVELFGSWSSDSGCMAVFNRVDKQLVLVSFRDTKQHLFENIPLKYKKQSVFTQFSSFNSTLAFDGTYSEGVMTIDRYCSRPLYKIKN